MRLLAIGLVVVSLSSAFADQKTVAREAYQRGMRQYNLGEYQTALEAFTAAYNEVPDPALLFNLAQCHRQLGAKQKAVTLYRSYLRESANAPNQAEVHRLIAGLEEALAQEKATSSAPPTGAIPPGEKRAAPVEEPAASPAPAPPVLAPPPAAAPPPVAAPPVAAPDLHAGRTKKIAGLTVGLVGVAAIAAGAALLALAGSASNDLTAADRAHQPFDKSKYDRGTSENLAGGVLLGVGGAAVVAGVVVGVLGLRESRATRIALVPWLDPHGAGALLTVRR
jgi:tetratricopeptide (TPR) repeat protein